MIAEAGLIALWLAAALAALQFGLVWLGISSAKEDLLAAVRPAAVAQGLLCALAFVLLIWLFVHSDMSVKLVAMNSHSMKPMLYKIAGTWGNHEGSMLLWVTIMGRSEEHTSELPVTNAHLVCRLLLAKKQ